MTFYIERDWLMRLIGRVVWGIDASVLYTSMDAISQAGDGATILDVPCGGGVALRTLRPDQDVRYIAVDISEKMLERAKRCTKRRSLSQVGFALADMRALRSVTGRREHQLVGMLDARGRHPITAPPGWRSASTSRRSSVSSTCVATTRASGVAFNAIDMPTRRNSGTSERESPIAAT